MVMGIEDNQMLPPIRPWNSLICLSFILMVFIKRRYEHVMLIKDLLMMWVNRICHNKVPEHQIIVPKASFIDYCYLLFLFYREKIDLRAYLSAYNKYF